MKKITYKEAGVNIDAGDDLVKRILPAVKSTMRQEVLAGVGGFSSLVALPEGYREPVLVSGTDGVGTKLKIAFKIGDHKTVGIDLVAMSVNDLLVVGAEPLFFLDYYACANLDSARAAEVIEGIAEGCRQAGCALVGGETAELPGFYQPGEYDLAGFVVGVVEKSKIITGDNVEAGDAVVGLSSNGLHSNGYSLARAIVGRARADLSVPLPGFEEPLGATLLRPTTIYAKAVKTLVRQVEVKAFAHITGGGLKENVPRTLPEGLGVELQAGWPVPPIFRWLAETGPVDPDEMLRTFNMGIGMTAVVAEENADKAVRILGECGVLAQIVGRVVEVPPGGKRVDVKGSF
jgi:phosphoribosylformylglycinamidine cyclo-ligase